MVLADLVAGTVAGFAICGVGHPFDTLKVLMQMQPGKYQGMMDAGRQTISQHGLLGLYKGVASPLVGNGLYNAVQFAIFAYAKRIATDNGRNDSLNRIGVAAGITGIFVAFVEGPQDLFKSQMQAQMLSAEGGAGSAPARPQYTGTFDCARTIVKERGLRGIYQGLQATVARNIIGVSAYFYFYEAAKKYMAAGKPVSTLSAWHVLLAGGIGGMGYWTLAYPLDIIKSAIQTDSIYPKQRRYHGFLDTAAKLWAEGGVKRYSAGVVPCLARSFPANAAGFAAYEIVKEFLEPSKPMTMIE